MKKFLIGNKEFTINKNGVTVSADIAFAIHESIQESVNHENKNYKVTSITQAADCHHISIPSSVESIGDILGCSSIGIPSSVKSIGDMINCFSINIPSSVIKIGNMHGCSNMKIDFPQGITKLGVISGLDGVSLPDTVTSIQGINNCSNITIPSKVAMLGDMYKCKNMIIDFPQRITKLGVISGLSEVSLPNTVTTIGGLDNCRGVNIPSSVISIGRLSCNGNLILTLPSSVLSISEIDGENGSMVLRMACVIPPSVGKVKYLSKDDQLVVPKGALDAYKSHPLWGKFKNITEDPTLGETTSAPAPAKQPAEQTPTLAKQPSKKPTEQTPAPAKQPSKVSAEQTSAAKQPTETDMKALDCLIDAALEDFVVTDEERSTLLKKADSIGLSRDEFKMLLDSRIQRCMKEKPDEKIEEKKKGFFARLFGK